jgi:hypothetical protein
MVEHLTGSEVFHGVKNVERLTLLGSTLSPGVIELVKGCLTLTAKVVGPALVGQKFDRFAPPDGEGAAGHVGRHLMEKVLKLCSLAEFDLTGWCEIPDRRRGV